jgi:hypothetical protein
MNRRIMFCSLVLLCFCAGIVQGQIYHQVMFSSNMQIIEETLDDGEMYTRVNMPDGWLTCNPRSLLPHSSCRSTTANAPANRQMPINHSHKRFYFIST